MRRCAFLEERQKLVLRAIERAHAGVGLAPDDEIERGEAGLHRRGVQRWIAAPVDKTPQHRSVAQIRDRGLDPSAVEHQELGVRHLARGHWELAVARAGHIPLYPYVVRFVR